MTKEEMAALLNGRQYTKEITKSEEELARAAGLVVIFGGSDDLCELRGAVNDETGAPGDVLITRNGNLLQPIEEDDAGVLTKHGVYEAALANRKRAIKITAWWESGEYLWRYETDEPHATFDVMEDNEKFCRGIVLSLAEAAK